MRDLIEQLRESIGRVYLGDLSSVERLIACLLSRGHALIEDVPGVGKTVLASALARSVGCKFTRIQMTPDMLPSDVLGVTVFERDSGRFVFRRGPVFTNLLLADEINRTTPRTQSALLEAMSEARVSVDGEPHTLGPPFMVVATQNPYEFEGTYPLPENQLDRFLMRISLGYPTAAAEAELIELRPSETMLEKVEPVLDAVQIVSMQAVVDRVRVDESIRRYIVELATATRGAEGVRVGVSPRGTLALAHAARAVAYMDGRDYVVPDDVYEHIVPVWAHRVITDDGVGTHAWERAAGMLEQIARGVASPA